MKIKICLSILMISLTLIKCEKNKGAVYERYTLIDNGSREYSTHYTLKKSSSEQSIRYRYIHESDSLRNVEFSFDPSNILHWGSDQFLKSTKSFIKVVELSDSKFYCFDNKDYGDDATGPIVFNEEYGVLAIVNVYGPSVFFLKEEKNKDLVETIKAKIIEHM